MKEIIIRIFKIPVYIIFIISVITVAIPILYWIVTGEDYVELIHKI